MILYLGAVDESCRVWVNGKYCGDLKFDALKEPDSWKKPFEVDITEHVRFNGDNTIAVKLTNTQGPGEFGNHAILFSAEAIGIPDCVHTFAAVKAPSRKIDLMPQCLVSGGSPAKQ